MLIDLNILLALEILSDFRLIFFTAVVILIRHHWPFYHFCFFSFLSKLSEIFLCILKRLASKLIMKSKFLVLVEEVFDFSISFNFKPHCFDSLSRLFSFSMVFMFYQIKVIFNFDPITLMFCSRKIIAFTLIIVNFLETPLAP